MTSAAVLGRLLYALAWIPGHLPFSVQRWLGGVAGRLVHALDRRAAKVARRNLELIEPGWTAAQRETQVGEILRATGSNAMETLRVWTHSRASNLKLVRSVRGREVLDAALAPGRGAIIAAPHYGNWELLLEYVASIVPLALVYRAPEKPAGDVFLQLARSGHNINLVRAEGTAMRPLFRSLKAGQVAGITPDQQPKQGAGEFSPFFGRLALTQTLVPKLAERSGAPVVFAWAEPVAGGFAIVFESAPAELGGADIAAATQAMNAKVEQIARGRTAWYQWTYKRFSKQPPGSAQKNPYYPDCY